MSGGAGLILIVVAIAIYFLPVIIGGCRDKAHGGFGILLLNLFLGWTVVGWFAALIWASSGTTKGELRIAEQRHRELLAALKGEKEVSRLMAISPDFTSRRGLR